MKRPKILFDLRKKTASSNNLKKRVNLAYRPQIVIPFRMFFGGVLMAFFVFYVVFNWTAISINDAVIAQDRDKTEERRALEAQLAELEKQMDAYEDKITEYRKQGKTLQSEIARLNNEVKKISLQIRAINLTLSRLNQEIKTTEGKIAETQGQINTKKSAIAALIQNIYENENEGGTLALLLAHPQISDFFSRLNNLVSVQDKLRANVEEIVALQNQLIDQKEIFVLQKADAEALKDFQNNQKNSIEKIKTDKDTLLTVTKGKESEYQKLLKETQKTAAQIRSRIYEFIGGGEMNFGDAYKLAKFAEEATGVRAAFILAVLDRESALGQNVGRCKYNEIKPPSKLPAMSPKRDVSFFLELMQELGINPDSVMVSCANRDGAYGGAMGMAQFLPSTWQLYSDRVAQLTGNNPPSPWKNVDAFMATALYLKDAGAVNGSVSSERKAAAKYYAGSRWPNYLWTYGQRVVAKAKQFQQDIDLLNA